jgi:hypothetical protein
LGGIDRARATDPVTDVALVCLIVRHELGGALDVAVVHLVVEEAVHGHHHGLLHLVGHHDPHHRLHLRRGRRLLETKERIVRDGPCRSGIWMAAAAVTGRRDRTLAAAGKGGSRVICSRGV